MKINSINSYNYNSKQSFTGIKESVLKQTAKVKEPVVKHLEGFYKNLSQKEYFQNFIHKISSSDKTFTHILVAESCFLSGFYMINTMKNKKIKKEQKPQMLINDALTLGVSTAGAYLAEEKIGNLVKSGAEKYIAKHADFYTGLAKEALTKMNDTPNSEKFLAKVGEVAVKKGSELTQGIDDVASMMGNHLKNIIGKGKNLKTFQMSPENFTKLQNSVKDKILENAGNADKAKEAVKKVAEGAYDSSAARIQADKILPGFDKLKTLVIFGIIYRYLGPVVITPIANKISSKFFYKQENSEEKAVDKK